MTMIIRDLYIKQFFLTVFIGMLIFSFLRCLITPSPIYASDEYAYLISGLCHNSKDLIAEYKKDPMLQQINDPLYNTIIKKAIDLNKDPSLLIRFLNIIIFYIILGFTGFAFLKKQNNEIQAYFYLFLLSLLPSGILALSIMPDIVVAGIFSSLVFIYIYKENSLGIHVIAGASIALLAYIKPHAIALFAGFLTYIIIKIIIDKSASKKKWISLFLFLSSALFALVIVNKYYYNIFTTKPLFIGNFYKGLVVMDSNTSKILLFNKIKLALWYGCGYLSSLVFLFPLAAYTSFLIIQQFLYQPLLTAKSSAFNFWLLCMTSTVSLIGMASVYAIELEGYETLRLWGRYLLPILPLWLALSALAISNKSSNRVKNRAVMFTVFSALGGIIFILLNKFKLQPWDYPELFSLFPKNNDYWGFTPLPYIREGVIVLIGLMTIACFLKFIKQKIILIAIVQSMTAIAGLISTMAWQSDHAKNMEAWTLAARSLKTLLPQNSETMIITHERYGRGSYTAYGLAEKPIIKELSEGLTIDQKDIPSQVDCIITTTNYKVHFNYLNHFNIGPLNIFVINGKIGNMFNLSKVLYSGEAINISLFDQHPNYTTIGFNSFTDWGAYMESERAEILLPYFISKGSYLVVVKAWSDINPEESLSINCGNEKIDIALSSDHKSYSFTVNLDEPIDRIIFSCNYLSKKNPWNNFCGAAISSITFKGINQ